MQVCVKGMQECVNIQCDKNYVEQECTRIGIRVTKVDEIKMKKQYDICVQEKACNLNWQ